MKEIRIGTRGSKLALLQAESIKSAIIARYTEVHLEIVKIKTAGDKILDAPLSKVGGKGLFVKEIEEALLRGDIDIAVHSMKDVPVELMRGLGIIAITEREDPRDVLISRDGRQFNELRNARLGTSSLRRQVQLKAVRNDLIIENLRGNLDTRVKKLKEGRYDAIVVAAAGLKRMGMVSEITEYLSSDIMLPAIGQGCLGIEARDDDEKTSQYIRFLNHEKSAIEVTAERAFLRRLQGGCQVPIAGYAVLRDGKLLLTGLVAGLDGKVIIKREKQGDKDSAEVLGKALAEEILNAGGNEILEEVYGRFKT